MTVWTFLSRHAGTCLARGIAGLVLAVSALMAPVQAQLITEQAGPGISAEERARLQELLAQAVPADLPKPQRIDLYGRKNVAAIRLGDWTAREAVLREWAAIDASGKWELRIALSGTEKHAEGLALGQQMIAEEKVPARLAQLRIRQANDLLSSGLTGPAKAQIDAATPLVPKDLNRLNLSDPDRYQALRLQALYHQASGDVLRVLGSWQDGLQQAKLASARAEQMVELAQKLPEEWRRREALDLAVRNLIGLSRQQVSSGLYADAEWSLREASKIAGRAGAGEAFMAPLYGAVASYYVSVGQFKEGLAYVDRAMSARGVRNTSPASAAGRPLYATRLQALVGQERWADAARLIAEVDAAVAARGGNLQAMAPYEQRMRVMVALHTGEHARVVDGLRTRIERSAQAIGPDHYFVASDRGLLAASLALSGKVAEAKPMFAQSVRGLTAPASLTGDFSEVAYQRQVRRYILQSYMRLLERSAQANPQDAVTLFEVADQLTTSSVQQALAEAAVRSGVTQPALAEIIRKEQDAKQEIGTLSVLLTGQGGEGGLRADPQQLDQARERVRELEALRRGYKAQIQKEFPDYFQLVQPKSPSPAEIAKQLRPGELFLAVTPLTDTTYVWAIDARGAVAFHNAGVGEGQLRIWVDKVRRTLDLAGFENGQVPAFAFADAHKVYQSVFAPFEAQIAGKRHLVVATGGALAQLPFAVLPRRAHEGSLVEAPWLLKDVAVSHVPSANGWLALKRLQQVPVAPEPLMAWGDPVFDLKKVNSQLPAWLQLAAAGPASDLPMALPQVALASANPANGAAGGLLRQGAKPAGGASTQGGGMDADNYVVYSQIQPLPETRDEVQALARILGANPQKDLVLGNQATRQSVLDASKAGTLAKKRVVVFATHGLLAGDLPNQNQPALAMAANPDANASPLLTLEDVLGLKLNADWVVLSACNTAGADGRAQEAMSGLARGFFYAGSRSLLVTHWSVESQSAMLLTTNTFEAYAKDPAITRAEALRQAMLKVMASRDYQHPAFWAPYALVGEGGR